MADTVLTGTAGDEKLQFHPRGETSAVTIDGGAANDRLTALGGYGQVQTLPVGARVLRGGAGDDRLTRGEVMEGGAGRDIPSIAIAVWHNETPARLVLDGGDGFDGLELQFQSGTGTSTRTPVMIDLTTGELRISGALGAVLTLNGVEALYDSKGRAPPSSATTARTSSAATPVVAPAATTPSCGSAATRRSRAAPAPTRCARAVRARTTPSAATTTAT